MRAMRLFAHYAKWVRSFSEKNNFVITLKQFLLPPIVIKAYEYLESEVAEGAPFVVKTDALDVAIGAALSQSNKPVACYSRTLSRSERR